MADTILWFSESNSTHGNTYKTQFLGQLVEVENISTISSKKQWTFHTQTQLESNNRKKQKY